MRDTSTNLFGPGPPPSETNLELEEIQKLGWGVTLTVSGIRPADSQRELLLLKEPDSDLIVFKESKWTGPWCGYFYTTIEHSRCHVHGYKLDRATEPCDPTTVYSDPRSSWSSIQKIQQLWQSQH